MIRGTLAGQLTSIHRNEAILQSNKVHNRGNITYTLLLEQPRTYPDRAVQRQTGANAEGIDVYLSRQSLTADLNKNS